MRYSFNIDSLDKYWNATQQRAHGYLADDLNEELAIECACNLWHLCDWYYEEHQATLGYKQLSELQGDYGKECSSLRVMRDVCNGSKHASLDKTRNPAIRNTALHEGAFSTDFSSDFDTSMLEAELADGSVVAFYEEVENCLKFWQSKLEP
jgi:hypothetical protein